MDKRADNSLEAQEDTLINKLTKYEKKWYRLFDWSDSTYYTDVWNALATLQKSYDKFKLGDETEHSIIEQIGKVIQACMTYFYHRPLHSRKTTLGKKRYDLILKISKKMHTMFWLLTHSEYSIESDDEDDIFDLEELEQENVTMMDKEHRNTFNAQYCQKYKLYAYPSESFKISRITPSDKDIQQGATGDCALLANIASLAKVNPQAIKDCFVAETKNTVTVRLFTSGLEDIYDENGEYEDTVSTVKKVHITMQKTSWEQLSLGAAWVRMLEKAFSIYFCKYYQNDDTAHRIILDALNPSMCMFALTGKPTGSIDSACLKNESGGKAFSSKSYSNERLALYKRIKKELESGRPVVCGRNLECGTTPGLEIRHAFGIIGADEDTPEGWPTGYKYITIRNPHKHEIRTYKFAKGKFTEAICQIPENDAEKGVSKLELNDFCNCFSYIALREKKQKGDNE